MGLFSALGSLAGSFFPGVGTAIGGAIGSAIDGRNDDRREDSVQNQNRADQMEINRQNIQAQKEANESNLAAQREFAQKGIQWKSADASAAGLHPLAVIGGAGASFSPSFQAGTAVAYRRSDPVARSMSDSGQNLVRAERADLTEYDREIQALAIRRGQLENSLLEGQVTAQWASVMGQPTNPPRPGNPVATGPGVRRAVPAGLVEAVASRQESAAPGDAGRSAGNSPGFRKQIISNQTSVDLPSTELAEVLEGMGVAGHVVGPLLMAKRDFDKRWYGHEKPTTPLPPGQTWEWSKLRQSWSPSGARKPAPFTPQRGGRSSRVPRSSGGASSNW